MYRGKKNHTRFGENEFARFWIEEPILYFEFKPHTSIDLPAAKKIVVDRLKFQEEKAYPLLCDIKGVTQIDKPARDYLAGPGSVLVKAVSFVTTPNVPLVLLRFYLETNKINFPTHLSLNRKQGEKSLTPYL